MREAIDLNQVKTFISQQPNSSRIYFGADSSVITVDGIEYADYATCVVVHIEGKHGGRVFGEIKRERNFEGKKNKPTVRLMQEVYNVVELYTHLADCVQDRYVELHLDVSSNERHGSGCILHQAVGYVRGTCNVTPVVKPNAWAATGAADRLKDILRETSNNASMGTNTTINNR